MTDLEYLKKLIDVPADHERAFRAMHDPGTLVRRIEAYFHEIIKRPFDRKPADFNAWYYGLYNRRVPILLIPVMARYFRQPKIAKRSETWFSAEIDLSTDHTLHPSLIETQWDKFMALGYAQPAGNHDYKGHFCTRAFRLCAAPPEVPLAEIRQLLGILDTYKVAMATNSSTKPIRELEDVNPHLIAYIRIVNECLSDEPLSCGRGIPTDEIPTIRQLNQLRRNRLAHRHRLVTPDSAPPRRRRGRPAKRKKPTTCLN